MAFSRRILYAAGLLAVTFAGALWWTQYHGELRNFVVHMLGYYVAMIGIVQGLTGGYEAGKRWMKRRLGQ